MMISRALKQYGPLIFLQSARQSQVVWNPHLHKIRAMLDLKPPAFQTGLYSRPFEPLKNGSLAKDVQVELSVRNAISPVHAVTWRPVNWKSTR